MPGPRLVSIVGKKNSGKTTLVVALVHEMIRRGHRVMTIKHGSHPFEFDTKGRDTWRHMHEGGAERVVMETPEARVVIAQAIQPMGPRELAEAYLRDAHFGDDGEVLGHRRTDTETLWCGYVPILDLARYRGVKSWYVVGAGLTTR